MPENIAQKSAGSMHKDAPKRVMVLGATGTIGQKTVQALVQHGHKVVCCVRLRSGVGAALSPSDVKARLEGAVVRVGDVTDPRSLEKDGFCGEPFDALVSCLASRTGAPQDAWRIDYKAHADALDIAKRAGISHMTLLSAICVQKPKLEFQKAKLAFEKELIDSGIAYTIVRATAFFKSLSGQVERVKQGKPYLVFGNGMLTACKPISDGDLGHFLAGCVGDERLHNRILPIGGPGEAITPNEQGEFLFKLLGQKPRFKNVPPGFLKGIASVLSVGGRIFPSLTTKAELARIGHYYATESMLVWDANLKEYSAEQTPSTGSETLFDYYESLVRGEAKLERGDHAVF